jgi:DNA invertase Pin-like site-specific DNA recombinase
MLSVFGAVAELEREYILQRKKEGIAIARGQGKYKGRKPLEHPDFDKVVDKWRNQEISAVKR